MPATPTNTWRRIGSGWGAAVDANDPEAVTGRTVTLTNRRGETTNVILGDFVGNWTDRNGNLRATFHIGERGVRQAPRRGLTFDSGSFASGGGNYTISSTISSTSVLTDNTWTPPAPQMIPVGTHVINYGSDDQQIYRVTTPRNRSYLAAYRLDPRRRTRTGRARWIYAGRAASMRSVQFSAETLLTEDQARTIGARLGFCANCGRALTADVSVDRGIGPVCFRRIREYRALLSSYPPLGGGGGYGRNADIEFPYSMYGQCRASSGNGFSCTRAVGHDGPHVAHYSDGARCDGRAPWTDEDLARAQAEADALRAAAAAEARAEEAELDDDNADPCDLLPACAYGPDGEMTDEWFDATMSMDREELAAYIARVAPGEVGVHRAAAATAIGLDLAAQAVVDGHEVDPLASETGRYCGQGNGDGYVCTRVPGHDGPHVAHVGGIRCQGVDPWTTVSA